MKSLMHATACESSFWNHLEGEGKKHRTDAEWDEAGYKPTQPVGGAPQAHHPDCLLQTSLLLLHYALDKHGHGVDPRQGQEEGNGTRQRAQKPAEGG